MLGMVLGNCTFSMSLGIGTVLDELTTRELCSKCGDCVGLCGIVWHCVGLVLLPVFASPQA